MLGGNIISSFLRVWINSELELYWLFYTHTNKFMYYNSGYSCFRNIIPIVNIIKCEIILQIKLNDID